jgi:hypothetical protein
MERINYLCYSTCPTNESGGIWLAAIASAKLLKKQGTNGMNSHRKGARLRRMTETVVDLR